MSKRGLDEIIEEATNVILTSTLDSSKEYKIAVSRYLITAYFLGVSDTEDKTKTKEKKR